MAAANDSFPLPRRRTTRRQRVVRAGAAAALVVSVGSTLLVAAETSPATVAPFSDVDPGAYYADAVEWARSEGIATGVGGVFEPQRDVTRAQSVTFLWRAAGSPTAEPSPAADVPRSAYYAPAVDWAYATGISTGAGTGLFEPSRSITRAEAVTFLWRHAGSPSSAPSGFTDLTGYEWAATAIGWAKERGVTTGVRAGTFQPSQDVTRAQYITMLWRAFLSPAPPTVPGIPAGWNLAWADEFDGTTLSSAWQPYHNTYGGGNNELQCLTPSNVSVSGGTLKIQARREQITCPNGSVRSFSSGFLGTRETGTYFPRYARFEIRAKLPHGQGIWPAFWLRHRNGASTAEVDVMEYFHSQVPGQTTGTLHLDGRSNVSKRTVPFEVPTATAGWHTWAVEIDPVADGVRFAFLLDGTAYHTYTDTQPAWADSADPAALWDMAVNVAVGGRWTGHPDDPLGYLRDLDSCAQGGTPPTQCRSDGILRAVFPATYEVDYVRVYTR